MRDGRGYGRESRRGYMQQRTGERQFIKKGFEVCVLLLCVLLALNLIFLVKMQSQLEDMSKTLHQVAGALQTARMDQEDESLVASGAEISVPHYQAVPGEENGSASHYQSVANKENESASRYQSASHETTEPAKAEEPGEIDYVELCGLDQVDKPEDRKPAQVLERLKELAGDNALIAEIYQNHASYPEEMLKALANNPEMADFVSHYLDTEAFSSGQGLTRAERQQDYPLFLQWDPRWGYAEYGDGSNIGLSGCGPTCLSMVFYYLLGDESLMPDVIGDYAMENGYYMPGTGTAWKLLDEAARKQGLSVYQPKASEWTLKQELDQGKMIICSMKPGDFTAGGHFIVIYGYDSEGFLVNDPNCVARSRQKWTYERIGRQIKNTWVYSADSVPDYRIVDTDSWG